MTLLPQELLKGSPWYVVSVRAVQCRADLLHLQLLLLHFHYILFHNGFKSLLKVVVLFHYWLVIYSKMLGHENLKFSTFGSYGLTPEILGRIKGPIISEDICSIFQLPKKYSIFLSLACWSLSFELSRTFLESLSKSWGFQLSPWWLDSDFQWIWQMICLICWWNYQKCTHFVIIHNDTFSNFKFRIIQDRNLEYFLGDMKNDSHFLKESHL